MARDRLLSNTNNSTSAAVAAYGSRRLQAVIVSAIAFLMAVAFFVCAPAYAHAAETTLSVPTSDGASTLGSVNVSYTESDGGVIIKKVVSNDVESFNVPNQIDGKLIKEIRLSNSTDSSSNLGSIKKLSIKHLSELTTIVCDRTSLTDVVIDGCSNLIKVDLSWSKYLARVECWFNTKLTSLDVRNCQDLTYLQCQGNLLPTLDVRTNTKLTDLNCSDNKLESLSVVTNLDLVNLLCNNNNLRGLVVRGLPKLHTLHCFDNQISSLDVANCASLANLECYNNELQSLDIRTLSNLNVLYCNNNKLTELDISKNGKLNILYCQDNLIASMSSLEAWAAQAGHSGSIKPQKPEAGSSSNGGSSSSSNNSGSDSSSSSSERTGKWIKQGNRWWYQYSNGTYPRNSRVVIDGKTYRFDSSGWMMTGWVSELNSWYYHNSSGAQVTGWQKVGGKWYYLDPNDSGIMVTGLQDIEGRKYFFASSGAMATGWVKASSGWYLMNSTGAAVSGWQKSGGKWYYLDPSTKVMKTGGATIDGEVYFFTSSGAMLTGWHNESDGWHYYKSSGAMAFGWVRTGGKWYYLGEPNGVMKTGVFQEDVKDPKDVYFANSNGAMMTGWQYLDKSKYPKIGQTGWYYFSKSGAMARNAWISNKYWVGEDGVMKTNSWVDGNRYFVGPDGAWMKNPPQR